MTRRLLKSACLACLLGTAATGHAQELGRADVSLTGITYRLVDLAPDDGIAPSVQFGAASNLSGHLYGDGDFDLQGGGPFSTETQEIVSADGRSRASLSGQAIHISGSIDEAVLRALAPHQLIHTGVAVNATEGLGNHGWAFTLSPHTAIVVEGRASLHTALDLSSLAGSDLVSGDARPFDVLDVSTSYYVQINLESREPSNPEMRSFFAEAGVYRQLTKDGWNGNPYPDEEKDFSLRLDNQSDQPGQRRLLLHALAITRAYGYPPIPEPGAWALALAGAAVVGVAAHTRRRRAPSPS